MPLFSRRTEIARESAEPRYPPALLYACRRAWGFRISARPPLLTEMGTATFARGPQIFHGPVIFDRNGLSRRSHQRRQDALTSLGSSAEEWPSRRSRGVAHLLEFVPADLAALARADPTILEDVRRIVGEGLEPILHVLRGLRGTYDVLILGVRGEEVIADHVVTIMPKDDPSRLPQARHRSGHREERAGSAR